MSDSPNEGELIRASERRFYLKVTGIYEQCSIDYDKHAETTQTREAGGTTC